MFSAVVVGLPDMAMLECLREQVGSRAQRRSHLLAFAAKGRTTLACQLRRCDTIQFKVVLPTAEERSQTPSEPAIQYPPMQPPPSR